MPPILHVPVGIPGCGKSTFAASMLHGGTVVSSDAIRAEPEFGGPNYQYDPALNAQVFAEYYRRIRWSLEVPRKDVIADATNLDAKYREDLYSIAVDCGALVYVVLFKNIAQAVARNAQRIGVVRVPDPAMLKMIMRYETTLQQLPFERPQDLLIEVSSVN